MPRLPRRPSRRDRSVGYALTLRGGLVRFADDAHIPIDTNLAGRGVRAVAVGRKNQYGSEVEVQARDARRGSLLHADRVRKARWHRAVGLAS